MIPQTTGLLEANIHGDFKTTSFSVKTSAKMFNILSSTIYKNPIRAVIREYSCNALDSHIAACNPEPYEVHLPTMLEPWFAVKDNGLGMPHDYITDLYTTYFHSSKEESNDFIGSLGIGSKSLFSITNSFTIISRYNGVKRTYSAFKNDQDCPELCLLTEEISDECNGVEVISPVDKSQTSKFRTEAEFVYNFLDVPKININIVQQKYDIKNDFIWMNKKSTKTQSYILMGGVPYEIRSSDVHPDYAKLIEHGVVLPVEMGSVSFNPGREYLSMDEPTKKYINDRCKYVMDNLAFLAEELYSKCKSYFSAKVLRETWACPLVKQLLKAKEDFNGESLSKVLKFESGREFVTVYRKRRKVVTETVSYNSVFILCRKAQKGRVNQYISNFDKYSDRSFTLIQESDIAQLGMCDSDYLDSNSLPETTASKRRKTNGFIFHPSEDKPTRAWTARDIPDDAVYVKLTGFEPDVYNLSKDVNMLYKLKIKVPDVYGIRNDVPDDAIHFTDWVKQNVKSPGKVMEENTGDVYRILREFHPEFKKISSICKIVGYNELAFYKKFEIPVEIDKSFDTIVEEFSKKHPVLQLIDSEWTYKNDKKKILKEYMNAITH